MATGSTEVILRLSKKLEKIISGDKGDDTAVDILKTLKSTPVTLEVLQKTRIGMTVNELRKRSQNKELQSEAKNLIKIWKKLLDAKGKNGSDAKERDRSGIPRSDSIASNMSDSNSMDSADNSFPVDTQMSVNRTESSSSSQGLSMSQGNKFQPKPTPPSKPQSAPTSSSSGYDDVRSKSRELIFKSLTHCDLPEGSLDANALATRIEQCIFDHFGTATNEKYRATIRSRVFNLRDKKNTELRENTLLGALSPERLATMTADELASKQMKDLRKTFTKQAIDDHQMSVESGTPSGMFKCGKCQKKNCTYTQVQTRSADEPMTTFVFCRECGNRWKFC